MNSKTAKCERTGNVVLLTDGYFVADAEANWLFVCVDAPDNPGDYNIEVSSLIKSPEAFIDWMAHLREKTWFNADKFFKFFTQLRANNNLYHSL